MIDSILHTIVHTMVTYKDSILYWSEIKDALPPPQDKVHRIKSEKYFLFLLNQWNYMSLFKWFLGLDLDIVFLVLGYEIIVDINCIIIVDLVRNVQ